MVKTFGVVWQGTFDVAEAEITKEIEE